MVKFDTQKKKPKLYNVIVVTLITAVFLLWIWAQGAENYRKEICLLLVIYYAVVLVLLLGAYRRQLRYNPYSYNTIYYMGFSLFLVSVIITHILVAVKVVYEPAKYRIRDIFLLVLDSAKNYIFISSPIIVLLSLFLFISTMELLRRDGRKLRNLPGIIMSSMLVGGLAVLICMDQNTRGNALQLIMFDLVTNTYAAVYLYFECMLTGTLLADVVAARYVPEEEQDFLIILGCGLKKDGTPNTLLQRRIDRALKFERRQREAGGKELFFVTSGGKGADEVISESLSMKRYLMAHGIAEDRIIEENRSTTTYENMKYSKDKIDSLAPEARIAFCTSSYHVFRSGLNARRVKMRAVGIGAPARWYFWPGAAVREFVGLLVTHKLKQAVIIGCMILIYILMTVAAYML